MVPNNCIVHVCDYTSRIFKWTYTKHDSNPEWEIHFNSKQEIHLPKEYTYRPLVRYRNIYTHYWSNQEIYRDNPTTERIIINNELTNRQYSQIHVETRPLGRVHLNTQLWPVKRFTDLRTTNQPLEYGSNQTISRAYLYIPIPKVWKRTNSQSHYRAPERKNIFLMVVYT